MQIPAWEVPQLLTTRSWEEGVEGSGHAGHAPYTVTEHLSVAAIRDRH